MGFAGFFAGGTTIFPVRAMGYELCGMRMARSAVGKGKDQYGDTGCARMTSKSRQRRKGKFCPTEVFSCGRLKLRGER